MCTLTDADVEVTTSEPPGEKRNYFKLLQTVLTSHLSIPIFAALHVPSLSLNVPSLSSNLLIYPLPFSPSSSPRLILLPPFLLPPPDQILL